MKRNGFSVRKGNYVGLKRVEVDGRRVWLYDGKVFHTLRDVQSYENAKKRGQA